jgi:hypothetical protein
MKRHIVGEELGPRPNDSTLTRSFYLSGVFPSNIGLDPERSRDQLLVVV